MLRFASSLAAAALEGLFDHPVKLVLLDFGLYHVFTSVERFCNSLLVYPTGGKDNRDDQVSHRHLLR
jgi:hypothetical protein